MLDAPAPSLGQFDEHVRERVAQLVERSGGDVASASSRAVEAIIQSDEALVGLEKKLVSLGLSSRVRHMIFEISFGLWLWKQGKKR